MLAHPSRKQRLAEGVIDLVRAGVQKVFALEINVRPTGMCSQSLRVEQRRRSAGVITQRQIQLTPETSSRVARA